MSRKLLPQQSHLQWSSSHNNHIFREAPPTTITSSVTLLPQQSHLQWSSSHNNHIFSEAPPTTTTSSVKLLPQQPHLQGSSSHNNHIFREAPPTTITSSVTLLPHNNHTFSEAPPTTTTYSVKLLPQQPHLQWSSSHCSSAINAGIFPSVYKWRRASEHQFEVKSAETELLKDRENMRDPEPCRMKHTEEQTGLCLFLIL